MAKLPKLDRAALQQISNIVGHTTTGLTGTEITKLLQESGIEEPTQPYTSKRDRLFQALNAKQEKDDCSNNVFALLMRFIAPINYVGADGLFHERRDQLNVLLAFHGFTITESGRIQITDKVSTLSEAHNKANRLRKVLSDRNVHGEVLKYCRSEFLDENYFHAVFEAVKGIADRIRTLSGLTTDGAELLDVAFNISHPILAINSLQTETEQSEQKGFVNLIKGLFGVFRNTTAHAPKVRWVIPEQDAFDLLTFASFVHRKLDTAVRVP